MTSSPILVTGGSGRIGRALQRVAADSPLVAVSGPNRAGGAPSLDISDAAATAELIAEVRPRVIVHLASLIGAACERDPALAEAVNVGGTAHLAAVAREYGVERIVFLSTAGVYGDSRRRPMVETDAPAVGGRYAATKLRAEQVLAEAAGPVAVDSLRVFNVYGPGMSDSLVTRLLTADAAHPVRLNGWDGFVRDYVHVDDVAHAILAAASSTAPGYRVLNVGSGIPRSNRDLVQSLPASVGAAVEIGPEVDSYSCADISAIIRELSWRPREPWPPTSA